MTIGKINTQHSGKHLGVCVSPRTKIKGECAFSLAERIHVYMKRGNTIIYHVFGMLFEDNPLVICCALFGGWLLMGLLEDEGNGFLDI